MNLLRNPDLMDRLAAEFALGTLKGGARRRFEHLARQHRDVRLAVQRWQDRLSGLAVLQPGVMPDSAVWQRIRNLVEADLAAQRLERQRDAARAAAKPTPSRGARALAWWRGAAIIGVAASALLVALNLRLLQQQAPAAARGQYVALLNDDKAAPALLVSFDPATRALTLQRVGSFAEGDDKSLQLWALPPGQGPQSLGVLSHAGVVRLQAPPGLEQVPTLAVSLEPRGGSPNPNGPTGPILFKGQLIRRTT